jgi:hypothetical protein
LDAAVKAPALPPNTLSGAPLRGPLSKDGLCEDRYSCKTKKVAHLTVRPPFDELLWVHWEDEGGSEESEALAVRVGTRWFDSELYSDMTFGRDTDASSVDKIEIKTIGARTLLVLEVSSTHSHLGHDDDVGTDSGDSYLTLIGVGPSGAPSEVRFGIGESQDQDPNYPEDGRPYDYAVAYEIGDGFIDIKPIAKTKPGDTGLGRKPLWWP